MLKRHTKHVPHNDDHGENKPSGHTSVCMGFPPSGNNPYDLQPGFEFLRSLIEARVIQRLEEIFEKVRLLEAIGSRKTNRRAIRLREVLKILGISKSTLYSRLNPASTGFDPEMPKPFKLGKQTSERAPSVWWESEVIAYLEVCAQARPF